MLVYTTQQYLVLCVAVMCGDGANDCGALKAAHAGISLSEAEASVASPFTSAEANISCVPRVIKEGRAALVTSFGIFKFMVLYSIMEFMSTVILYSIDSNLTDFEFLYIDLCLVVHLAFSFGRNHAYSGPLAHQPPLTSLLSRIPLTSLLLQILCMSAFQFISLNIIYTFPWFVPFVYKSADYYICYENYAVFSVSQFQYIIMAFVFSQGAPYREPVYKNKIFFSSMCLMTVLSAYITLYPAQWIVNFLQLRFPPNIKFPLVVIALALCNFVVSLILESFIVQYLMFKKIRSCNADLKDTSREYLTIEKELNLEKDWPPISKINPLTSSSHQSGLQGHENFAFEEDSPKQPNLTTKL